MTNREYTALVEKGTFPEDPIVPMDEPFVNQNGSIHNLVTEKFTHVAMLTTPEGAIRANHYHKTDWHYSYVVSGVIGYYHRPAGSKETPKLIICTPGMMVFSPPLVEHAKFFHQDTVYFTFAKNARSEHQTHEDDLVRVPMLKRVWDQKQGLWSPAYVDESLK